MFVYTVKKQWLRLVFICFASAALADDIKDVCNLDPLTCLSETVHRQQSHQAGSLEWWALEELRLESLFELQKNDELYAAVRPWVGNASVPAEYEPVIQLFLGKWLRASERADESKVVLNKALSGFQQQYAAMPSQQSGIRVLNLLVVLDKFDEASAFANELELQNFDAPIFYREMFAELGHVAHRRNALALHIEYRLKSLLWAKKVPDMQQQAIAHNNYGVALRESQKFIMAESAFLDGLVCAEQAKDVAQVNTIRLRIAEVAKLQNNTAKSKQWFNKVVLSELPAVQIRYYRQLADELVL